MIASLWTLTVRALTVSVVNEEYVQLARATGRAETRVAQEFVAFARERLS